MMIRLEGEQICSILPVHVIAIVRYGPSWDTIQRKRQWAQEFSDKEKRAAEDIFEKSKLWAIRQNVPTELDISPNVYILWQKLGRFCTSIFLDISIS